MRPVTNVTNKRPGMCLSYDRLVLVSFVKKMLVTRNKIIELELT
jgi:hypothetical protein